jgi:hypothetical protein
MDVLREGGNREKTKDDKEFGFHKCIRLLFEIHCKSATNFVFSASH